jgi:hypothetical protein
MTPYVASASQTLTREQKTEALRYAIAMRAAGYRWDDTGQPFTHQECMNWGVEYVFDRRSHPQLGHEFGQTIGRPWNDKENLFTPEKVGFWDHLFGLGMSFGLLNVMMIIGRPAEKREVAARAAIWGSVVPWPYEPNRPDRPL